jgi:hypothetical protein
VVIKSDLITKLFIVTSYYFIKKKNNNNRKFSCPCVMALMIACKKSNRKVGLYVTRMPTTNVCGLGKFAFITMLMYHRQ